MGDHAFAGLDSDDDMQAHQHDASKPGRTAAQVQAAGLEDSDDEPRTPAVAEPLADAAGELKGTGLEESDDDLIREQEDPGGANQDAQAATGKIRGPPEVRAASSIRDLRVLCSAFLTKRGAQTWQVPLVPRPDESLYMITFKSMVDIESKPYSADEFTLDEKIAFDDCGNRIHRAPPLNRIRYRFNYENTGTELNMESNARIVRWSDNSVSLFIGSECVDLKEEPIDGQQLLLGAKHPSLDIIQVCSSQDLGQR
jgi:Leo1-like protein